MPGNPIAKAKRVDNLVSWFDEWNVDFDATLPQCYKGTGEHPGRDVRADAWRQVHHQRVLLRDALGTLQTALRASVISRSGVNRGRKGYCVRSATN